MYTYSLKYLFSGKNNKYFDELVVPIVEGQPEEIDLAVSINFTMLSLTNILCLVSRIDMVNLNSRSLIVLIRFVHTCPFASLFGATCITCI